jgi:hypothetical protein
MNAKDQAKFTMFKSLEQHFDANADIVSTIAALAAAVTAFKAIITAIIGAEQLTNVNLTGIAVDKSTAKLTLAQTAADIAAVIGAFAAATGNGTLEAEVKYTFNKLKRMRDEQLAPVCQIIHDRAVENETALADYGITTAKITGLQRAITDYAAKTPNTRTAVGNRKTQTAQRQELFRQGTTILKKQIDNLIKNFRITEPNFHETYFNLREIKDPSKTTTTLKGIITDRADGKPIKNALITIVQLAKTAKTDSTGEYSIKPVEHGKYTVIVTAEGYQTFESDEVEVKLGDIKHLDVSLMK